MIRRALLPLVLVGVACGESLAADTTGGGDGGTDGGARNACDDKIIYVAGDTGRDGNDGCAPERAIRTIGGALGLVTSKKLLDREIHVCAGKYSEASLSLVVPVPLRGGYNCQTWTRGDAFGKKGGFVDPNVTQIENAGTPGNPTLLVSGAAVTHAAIVDGFTVLAVPTGNVSSVALAIGDKATPVLSDLVVVGGGTTGVADGLGSVGIDVASDAAPEIKDSDLRGGNGVAPTGSVPGSVAVRAHGAGAVYLHDAKITSGTGTGFTGSVAVLVEASNGVRIERNEIDFGGSTSAADTGSGAEGVNVVNSSEVVIQDNVLRGGTAKCGVGRCGMFGIVAAAPNLSGATARIHRNRIYAGELDVGGGTLPVLTNAIFVHADTDATITSNVLHGGGTQRLGAWPVTILVDSTKRTLIHGNTIVAVSKVAAKNHALEVTSGSPTGKSKDVSVVGNLFVGGDGPSDSALYTRTCEGVVYTALTSNAFVGFPGVEIEEGPDTCGQTVDHPAVKDLEARYGVPAHGNLALKPSCGEPACIARPCADYDACAAIVFASWDKAGAGTMNVFGDGPRLSATAPCAIVRSDAMLDATASPDVFGTMRDAPFTVGAHETVACQ